MVFHSRLGSLLVAMMLAFPSMGQDWHFSQFQANPQSVDPALTGAFDGTLRISSQYRNQWNFAARFNTFSLAMDAPFARLRNGDYFGGGLQILVDQAGDLQYRTTSLIGGLAFHKALSPGANHYLSIGYQAGYALRSVDFTQINAFDPEPASLLASNRFGFLDMGFGLNWYKAKGRNSFYYAGAGLFHPHGPDQSFRRDGSDPLAARWTFYGGASFGLGRSVFWQPATVQMVQGNHREWNAGMNMKWWLNESQQLYQQEKALYVGVWYRWQDAVIPSIRFDYQDITVGLSYDINISSLSNVSGGSGGPEVSLVYALYRGRGAGAKQRQYQQMVCPNFF